MLGRDKLVVERRSDARCRLKDAHQLRREVELERGRNGCIARGAFDKLQHGIGKMCNVDIYLFEHRHHDGFLLHKECCEQVER